MISARASHIVPLALALPLALLGCAETPTAPAVAPRAARALTTTITLPPAGAIPDGAPTIDVPEHGAARAKAAPTDVDHLLGSAPADTNAEAVVRTTLFPRARACYAAQRENGHARAVVALQVRADGSVAASTVEVAVGLTPETMKCIEASAKKLVFVPPGRRGANVTIPMSFAPDDERAQDDVVQRDVVPIVLACYAAAQSGGSGGIDFVVKIGADGAPLDVTGARDPSVGAEVAACATEKLRALKFDAAAGREIVVPFELRAAP